MSQTNAFYKAQNPDYVYLDLQQSNVYNNTNDPEVDVAFIETRDSPVINNTGEYNMSVTRFQIDTYKLPTMVVEPDLTQGDPNVTVHKVAIMTESATQVNPAAGLTTTLLTTVTGGSAGNAFGKQVGFAHQAQIAVIGAPTATTANPEGAVYVNSLTAPFTTTETATLLVNKPMPVSTPLKTITFAGQSVDITNDGDIIVGLRYLTDPSGSNLIQVEQWVAPDYTTSYVEDTGFNSSQAGAVFSNNVVKISDSATTLNTAWTRAIVTGFPSLKKTLIHFTNSSYAIVADKTLTQTSGTSQFGAAVAISSNSKYVIVGNPETAIVGSVNVSIYEYSNTNTTYSLSLGFTPGTTINNNNLGFSVAISDDGSAFAAGAPSAGATVDYGLVEIFRRVGSVVQQQQQLLPPVGGVAMRFGLSVSLNNDGTVLTVGCVSHTNVDANVVAYVYTRVDADAQFTSTPTRVISANLTTVNSIAMNTAGTRFVLGEGASSGTSRVEYREFNPNISHYIDYLPAANKNIASVANVVWKPNPSSPIPSIYSLNGKNTVEYPYYWCNSYDYFIGLVNTALEQSAASNYNYLYNEWVQGSGSDAIKSVFFEAAYKSFPTPPFLDWEHDTLKASMYVNQCYNKFLASNYAVPGITWGTPDANTGIVATPPPFTFKVGLSPSLYALFSSFPATETMLTTTTGTVEKFYVLDINSSGYPLVTPNPTIQKTLYSSYVFNSLIYNVAGTFRYVLTPTTATTYPYSNLFTQVHQELSTIDTWCPVNGIVFTTNTLPIITNQFSSNSVINSNRPSFETGAEYALIITDLQTNEQGYKPNLLYNPTAEYRRIDMTGNRALTNIDIRVFWRAKTGQLIPFKLSSGVSASIKILFQKKILGEKQQMQLAQTIRELDL
jgi:hypothetical protein